MLSILLTAPHVAAGDRDAPPALHAFDDWSQLAPLPDDFGFAGPFVGVSDGALIVAGGANFPDGPPWDGKAKVWHDRIFVLADPAGQWQQLDTRLPAKLGYGVSITTPDGILCIGGCDAQA